jgi:HemY protein
MKLLVTVLVTLIIAVSLALMAIENPGYVLIAVGPWTVETTLALSVIMAILAFAAVYYTIRFVSRMLGVPGGVRHWRQRRRERKAMVSLTRGLIDLAEGHWQRSEKQLLKNVNDGHAPLLNYLAAARAAQAQGADQRRDNYLKQAHESVAGADIAVGLTQAELQLQHNQLEQALATLRHLQQLSPKHAQVLTALAKLYEELGDWEHLLELMPSLRKRNVFSGEEIETLSRKSYLALFKMQTVVKGNDVLNSSTANAENIKHLKDLWERIPKHFRENEKMLLCYVQRLVECGETDHLEPLIRSAVQRLVECGETDHLEPLIRSALKNNRSEALVYCYGLVTSADYNHHLSMAESLLIGHENDAVALLTVGRLSLRDKLWGKAQSYLEASVNSHPSAEAYNELGNLLDSLGESDRASECFREGLRLAPGCENSIPIVMDAVVGNSVGNTAGNTIVESDLDNVTANTLESFQDEPEEDSHHGDDVEDSKKKALT